AASLYQDLDPKSIYFDKRSGLSQDQYKEKLSNSTTLYVGNLSFYTSETQLLEFFQLCGEVVNLIMGLNREKKQPCGFCFVEYATREEAALAIECLNLSVVDGRQIRIDWDPGFEPGRQYGRGKSGGQVRDELKPDFADKRGGYQRYSGGNYDSNRGGYRGGHGGGNYRNSDRSDYNRGGDRGNNYDNNNYRKRQYRDNDGGDDENNDNDSKRKRFRRDYSNDRNRNNNNDRDHD
uniref:Nuclear cap-binding protein subunit 2 n=1 Tax=Petromyzon marinus TaxID=7757 RepID=S4RPP8_PETMA